MIAACVGIGAESFEKKWLKVRKGVRCYPSFN